jgi:hypothetical protein
LAVVAQGNLLLVTLKEQVAQIQYLVLLHLLAVGEEQME